MLHAALTPDGSAVYDVRMGDHFDLWKLPPSELDVRHVAIHPDGHQLAYVGMATVSGLRSLPLRRTGLPAGPSVRTFST